MRLVFRIFLNLWLQLPRYHVDLPGCISMALANHFTPDTLVWLHTLSAGCPPTIIKLGGPKARNGFTTLIEGYELYGILFPVTLNVECRI